MVKESYVIILSPVDSVDYYASALYENAQTLT